MADGTPMQPRSNNAASKTLPLGTTAKVTNLETGQSALVTIRDRRPYIRGRIVDLSPSTAKEIGLDHEKGVTKVAVAPIAVPLADGSVKLVADARSVRSQASEQRLGRAGRFFLTGTWTSVGGALAPRAWVPGAFSEPQSSQPPQAP